MSRKGRRDLRLDRPSVDLMNGPPYLILKMVFPRKSTSWHALGSHTNIISLHVPTYATLAFQSQPCNSTFDTVVAFRCVTRGWKQRMESLSISEKLRRCPYMHERRKYVESGSSHRQKIGSTLISVADDLRDGSYLRSTEYSSRDQEQNSTIRSL